MGVLVVGGSLAPAGAFLWPATEGPARSPPMSGRIHCSACRGSEEVYFALPHRLCGGRGQAHSMPSLHPDGCSEILHRRSASHSPRVCVPHV